MSTPPIAVDSPPLAAQPLRHVLGISGGKDSAALAIYLSRITNAAYYADLLRQDGLDDFAAQVEREDKVPEIEYFFTDTGKELPEVYEFIARLEAYLGKEIHCPPSVKDGERVLNGKDPFDHFLIAEHFGMLPSQRHRWCTLKMKIYPFERFIDGDTAVNYVGIRHDENRRARLSARENIHAVYPFIRDRIVREDVFRILEESVGIPDYYRWRSRSGCFFCFFQRKSEWLGLRRKHPDLFRKAMEYENESYDPATGRKYTWMEQMSLEELDRNAPELEAAAALASTGKKSPKQGDWKSIVLAREDDDPEDQACAICSL